MEKINAVSKYILILFIFLPCIALAGNSLDETSLKIVDLMNTTLILVCSLFVVAILFVLMNKKSYKLLKSSQFLNMNTIVSSWILISGAFLLYAASEIGFISGFIKDMKLYMLSKTMFVVLFAAGLFIVL